MATWKRFALLIAAAAALVFGWDLLTTSDEEAIGAALDRSLERLVARDAADALEIVDNAFEQEGLKKADLAAGLRRMLESDPARALETVQRQVETDADEARVRTRVRYFPAPEARMPYPFDSDLVLHMRRRGKKDWRIVRLELASVGGMERPALARVLKTGR